MKNLTFGLTMVSKDELEFMKTDHPVTPVIYTLPKVHKSQTVPLVGRPIVSSIGSLTNNISTFVDHLLKPWVVTLSSYTRDTIDFLTKLKAITVPSECLLVTFDVSSLYTSIPHNGGIEAVNYFLRQRDPSDKPSTACISELTELVLTSDHKLF